MAMDEKLIRLVFGKRGSGKSVLARSLIHNQNRYVIYDTLGEYTAGVTICDLDTLKRFWLKVYQRNFRIVYQPLDPDAEFDAVCELVWECQDMTFLVEEIDQYCQLHRMSPEMKNIVQRGRHRHIELIGVTQRPANIDRLLTSQTKEMYILSMTEPRDIAYFKDAINGNIEEKIEALEQYQYVHWQENEEELKIGKAS